MMRYGLWILLTCILIGECDAQIFRPTGRYAVQSEVVQPPGVQTVKVKTRTRFLVSETWCRNCESRKTLFKSNGWPEANIITIGQCQQMFGFRPPHIPYEFVEPEATEAVSEVRKANPPVRYIQWPGWGTIDLQTYNRNCNCSMCQSLRAKQQEYQRQLREYQQSQASLPADQQPCPIETIETMLDLMQLRSDDVLADLGCGDGRILIAAAKRGIRGIGVELDHARVSVAVANVNAAGLSHLVRVEQGDARSFDSSRVTAITAYLYPTLLEELAPKMRLARVVGSPYHEVPGLPMKQHRDIWIYRKQPAAVVGL